MHWGWKENPSSAAVQSADGFRRDAFPSMFDMSISMTWSSAEVNHGDIWWQSWIHVVEPCIVEPCGMQEFYGVLFVLGDLGDLGDLGVPCKCELRTSENVHFVLSLVRILSFFRLRSDGGVWEPFTYVSRTCSWFDHIWYLEIYWIPIIINHHPSSSIIIHYLVLHLFFPILSHQFWWFRTRPLPDCTESQVGPQLEAGSKTVEGVGFLMTDFDAAHGNIWQLESLESSNVKRHISKYLEISAVSSRVEYQERNRSDVLRIFETSLVFVRRAWASFPVSSQEFRRCIAASCLDGK